MLAELLNQIAARYLSLRGLKRTLGSLDVSSTDPGMGPCGDTVIGRRVHLGGCCASYHSPGSVLIEDDGAGQALASVSGFFFAPDAFEVCVYSELGVNPIPLMSIQEGG